MPNSNCLENCRCPNCGNVQSFQVVATAVFTVHDDGTDFGSNVEYDNESPAYCTQCDWVGEWGQLAPLMENSRLETSCGSCIHGKRNTGLLIPVQERRYFCMKTSQVRDEAAQDILGALQAQSAGMCPMFD